MDTKVSEGDKGNKGGNDGKVNKVSEGGKSNKGGKVKICLCMIVKNEEKILSRLLESVIPYVDAISIVDTGSTDNTVNIIKSINKSPLANIAKHKPLPVNCTVVPWKNFGYNRTRSFFETVAYCHKLGWNLGSSYALLLDADMVLKVHDGNQQPFANLTRHGYHIKQKTSSLSYVNTRLCRLDRPWRSVGVTHEYWGHIAPPPKLTSSQLKNVINGKDINNDTNIDDESKESKDDKQEEEFATRLDLLTGVWIHDISDGGSKHDKFERDIKLLTQGLIDEPKNSRYVFYLAESYRNNKQFDLAIEHYHKRITMRGWAEEVWYSHYCIGRCYECLKDEDNLNKWYWLAYIYRSERVESLLKLCKYYRIKGDYCQAYGIAKLGKDIVDAKPLSQMKERLFVDIETYTYGFDYELSILRYYVTTDDDILPTIPDTHNTLITTNTPDTSDTTNTPNIFIVTSTDNVDTPNSDIGNNSDNNSDNNGNNMMRRMKDGLKHCNCVLYNPECKELYRELTLSNIKYYVSKLSTVKTQNYDLPDIFHGNTPNLFPSTPGICLSGDTQYVIQRCGSCVATKDMNPNGTRKYNYFDSRVTIRNCLYTIQNGDIINKFEIKEDLSLYSDKDLLGLEDIRLFTWKNNELWATATTYRFTHTPQVALFKVEPYVNYIYHLSCSKNTTFEKNWAVVIPSNTNTNNNNNTNEINIVYCHEPMTIVTYSYPLSDSNDKKKKEKNKQGIKTGQTLKPIREQIISNPGMNLSVIRGSSYIIPYRHKDIHYLSITHIVAKQRYYYHVFVGYNNKLVPIHVSLPFYFNSIGVEFCCGFVFDSTTNTFLISHSEFDANTLVTTVSEDTVKSYLP